MEITKPFTEHPFKNISREECIAAFREFGFKGEINPDPITSMNSKAITPKGPDDTVIAIMMDKNTFVYDKTSLETLKMSNPRFAHHIIDCKIEERKNNKLLEILMKKESRNHWAKEADLQVAYRLQHYLAFDKIPDEQADLILTKKGKERINALKMIKNEMGINGSIYIKMEKSPDSLDKHGMRIDNFQVAGKDIKRVSFRIWIQSI